MPISVRTPLLSDRTTPLLDKAWMGSHMVKECSSMPPYHRNCEAQSFKKPSLEHVNPLAGGTQERVGTPWLGAHSKEGAEHR